MSSPVSLDNAVFFDMEVFRHETGVSVWAAGFRWMKDGELKTRIIDSRLPGASLDLRRFIQSIDGTDRYLIGYNLEAFDLPLVAEILSGRGSDIRDFSDNLIGSMNSARGIERAELLRNRVRSWIDLIPGSRVVDLIYRSPSGDDPGDGERPDDELRPIGLKHFLTQLGEADVRVMPVDHRLEIDNNQWDEVKAYCLEDLKGTERVFLHYAGTINSLRNLSEKYGYWLVNRTDSQVGELVLRSEFKLRTKSDPPRVPAPDSFKVLRPDNFVEVRNSESVRNWVEFLLSTRFPLEDGVLIRTKKNNLNPDPKTLEVSRVVEIGPYRFQTGFGGLHQIIEPGYFKPGNGFRLLSVDVRSFYPSIASNLCLPLGGMGSTGTEILRELMSERFRLKDISQDKGRDKSERDEARTASDSLKIVINAVFGRTGFRHSALYSPGTLFSITLLGQTYLLSLIERLIEIGCIPIDSNTDGIYCLVPEESGFEIVLDQWQQETGFTLETEGLEGLIVQAQNIRLTRKIGGNWTGKGTVFGSISGRNPGGRKIDPPIVTKAVIAALVDRVPLVETIRRSKDPRDFIFTKKYKSSTRVSMRTRDGEIRLDSLIRGYASTTGGEILSSTDRADQNVPERVSLAYTIPGELPEDLDHSFYVTQARRVLEKFREGFRSDDLSGLALEVWNRGLVPSPAIGKKSLKGSSDKAPAVSLEDWPNIPTIKAYSGHRPGGVEGARPVLIVDIDDPARWKDQLGFNLEDLRGSDCLTVYSGESPEEVRNSESRGKLIFEFDCPDDHRFRRMRNSKNKALEKAGIEIFYGQRPVSVLGRGEGKEYKLEGKLGSLPDWLESLLLRLAGKNPPPTPGKRPRGETSDDARYDHSTDPNFDEIFDELGERFDPRFREVRYRLKRMSGERGGEVDSRLYAVFRCPEGHSRSDDSEGMLILDWDRGHPVYSCKHSSCNFSNGFYKWTLSQYPEGPEPSGTDDPESSSESEEDLEAFREGLSPIGQVMTGPLEPGTEVVVIHAGTGAGKTHSSIDAAYHSIRTGRNFLYLAPSRQLLMSFQSRLRERYPSIGDRVINVSMAAPGSEEGIDDNVEETVPDEIVFDISGTRVEPEEVPQIYLACHELSYRRGFSRFMSRLWTTIEDRPHPFDIVIDESHQFLRGSSINIPLSRRHENRQVGNKVRSTCIDDCPANRSLTMGGPGSCEGCELVQISGAYSVSSKFNIPELIRPRFNDREGLGEELVIHQGTRVELTEEGIETGEPFVIETTTTVREIKGFKGRPINRETRRDLWRLGFKGVRNSESDFHEGPETSETIFEHILGHLFGASIKVSNPTDRDGKALSRDEVIGIEKSIRADNVIFPVRACQAPRVQGIDLAPVEMFRRMTSSRGSRLIFMSASFGRLDREILIDVFGEEGDGWKYHRVEGQSSRVDAIQVVNVINPERPFPALIQSLSPAWLEKWKEYGPGVVFAPSERIMNVAHDSIVRKINMSETPISINCQLAKGSGASLSPTTTSTIHSGIDWTFATPRKPIATGYDGLELVSVIVDLNSTRLAEDLIVSHGSGPEDYIQAREEELLDQVSQAMGRVGRGPRDKRAVVVVINADRVEVDRLLEVGGLSERAERIGFSTYPVLCSNLFEDGAQFLEGKAWVVNLPNSEDRKKNHRRMRTSDRESKRQTKTESVLVKAIKAKEDGKTFSEFCNGNNISRLERSYPGLRDRVRMLWDEVEENGLD